MVSTWLAQIGRRLGISGEPRAGLVSDGLVFATNLVFLTPASQWFESLVSRALDDDAAAAELLATLLGVAVALQAAGAYLKRRPLQARLAAEGPPRDLGCTGSALLLCNYILSLLILITVVAFVPALNDAEPWSSIATLFVAMVPTYLVYRAMSPAAPAKRSWLDAPQVEWVADAFLLVYVVTNTLFFNFLTAYKAAPPASLADVFNHLLSVVVILAIVCLWYLPPRLLFLVDEVKQSGVWLRIVLVMAPIAFRWVVG